MKTIHYATISLLLIIGAGHLYKGITTPADPKFIANLVYGGVYLVLGVLLIMKIRLSIWLGFIASLITLVAGSFYGYKNLSAYTWIMIVLFALTALCCFVLLINRKKPGLYT